ncbi:putative serine/threonine-protein kinase WNK4 [Vitis vinifera]|uniref:non-specific serine/threonine protein kinase n=1 Tax=Vitis vinifera TaxID=29760 RepID=A0A438DQ23_VITVI|nr:putative serine/threonine-protein kinase WNK4 [Vitis vinifera]
MAKGLCELLWLKRLLAEIDFAPKFEMNLFCDNKAATNISHNPVQHDQTKHVEVDRHFIKYNLDTNTIRFPFVKSEDQLADILTKVVSSKDFHNSLIKLHMKDPSVGIYIQNGIAQSSQNVLELLRKVDQSRDRSAACSRLPLLNHSLVSRSSSQSVNSLNSHTFPEIEDKSHAWLTSTAPVRSLPPSRETSQRESRYNEFLGKGAFETVYKEFDEVDGIEVAWGQAEIEDLLQSPLQLERLYSKSYSLLGVLRQYRKKHKNVDLRALKNWAKQILRVSEPQVKYFIEKRLVPASLRLPAQVLLKDAFFATKNSKEPVYNHMQLFNSARNSFNLQESQSHGMDPDPKVDGLSPMDMDPNYKKLSVSTHVKSISGTPHFPALQFERFNKNNLFELRGEKIDDNSISTTLHIADPCRAKNNHFAFYLDSDTGLSIAGEMVKQLDLSNEDVAVIAELRVHQTQLLNNIISHCRVMGKNKTL